MHRLLAIIEFGVECLFLCVNVDSLVAESTVLACMNHVLKNDFQFQMWLRCFLCNAVNGRAVPFSHIPTAVVLFFRLLAWLL